MTPSIPTVSIVVTTRNEEANIWNCLQSIALQEFQGVEICVVDNFCDDRTIEIAREFTDKIALLGPECCRQRNFGLAYLATVRVFGFIEVDMTIGSSVVQLTINVIENCGFDTFVDELISGTSRIARIRLCERSLHVGTFIDCARFLCREASLASGGFDETLKGPKDCDENMQMQDAVTVATNSTSRAKTRSFWPLRGRWAGPTTPEIRQTQIAHYAISQGLRLCHTERRNLSQSLPPCTAHSCHLHRQPCRHRRIVWMQIEKKTWAKSSQQPFSPIRMIMLGPLSALALIPAHPRGESRAF
jgi:hypothetical protein